MLANTVYNYSRLMTTHTVTPVDFTLGNCKAHHSTYHLTLLCNTLAWEICESAHTELSLSNISFVKSQDNEAVRISFSAFRKCFFLIGNPKMTDHEIRLFKKGQRKSYKQTDIDRPLKQMTFQSLSETEAESCSRILILTNLLILLLRFCIKKLTLIFKI